MLKSIAASALLAISFAPFAAQADDQSDHCRLNGALAAGQRSRAKLSIEPPNPQDLRLGWRLLRRHKPGDVEINRHRRF